MTRRAYLIGTQHDLQVGEASQPRADVAAFEAVLLGACSEYGIRAVAEEMSEEAVRDRGQQESIALRVARQLGLAHRYCDPETPARDRLGIREESALHLDAFFGKITRDEVPSAIRVEHAKREALWLVEVERLDVWPLLFVCGRKHTETFKGLLIQRGVTCEVISPRPGG